MENYVYVTKSVNKDLTAHGGFQYPKSGIVEAPDWKATETCGKGLHGFLWGEGKGDLADYDADHVWLLIKVNMNDGFVDLKDKVKFRRGEVVAVGDCKTVTEKLKECLPKDRLYKVNGGTASAGDYGTATAGDYGTASAGDYGTATAGYGGTASAGKGGIISILYRDKKDAVRRKTAEIDRDGLKPNVPYRLDDEYNFVEVIPLKKRRDPIGQAM